MMKSQVSSVPRNPALSRTQPLVVHRLPSAAWHTAAGPMPVWVIQTNIIHRLFKQIFLLATQYIFSQQIPFASFKFDKNVSGHSLSLFISRLSLPENASLFIPRP